MNAVVDGAVLTCSLADAQNLGSLVVPSVRKCRKGTQGIGIISDTNVTSMGVCTIISGGNSGPCVPAPMGNWSPGASKVKCEGVAVLKEADTLSCSVGGTISIHSAGQTKVQVS